MARVSSTGIKKKRVSIYPVQDLFDAFDLQHIELQSQLRRHISRNIHSDAVLIVGMSHLDEVTGEIEKIIDSNNDSRRRKLLTLNMTKVIMEKFNLQHIDIQSLLKRHIDRNIHSDAVLIVGMSHLDEIIRVINDLTNQE